MNSLRPILLTLAILAHGGAEAAQMRSRSESVPDVQATNTVGLGDIWVTGGLSSYFRVRPVPSDRLSELVDTGYRGDFFQLYGKENRLQRELIVAPEIGGTVGLANFMHLEVQSVPWDGEKLGATTARLKFTTPGNDNLRLFGLGISLNATLSTEEDIYSRGETTPGFDPILSLSVLADLDLIKAAAGLPVKLYVNYTNLDDQRLAHAYTQHQLMVAAEWKGWKRGAYARLATLLYKPLPTKLNPDPKDEYLAPFFQLGLGWRTALGERYAFTADVSFDPLQPLSFYDRDRLKPPKVKVEVSRALFYNETQAEAIRALIFNEQQRRKFRALAAKQPKADAVGGAGADSAAAAGKNRPKALDLDGLGLEERKALQEDELFKGVFEEQAQEAADKRKQIRSQLKQIEELLE